MGIKVYKKKIKLTKLIKVLVVVVVTVLILVGITESIVAEISQRTKKISGLSIVNSKSWREREETGYSLNVAVKVRNVNPAYQSAVLTVIVRDEKGREIASKSNWVENIRPGAVKEAIIVFDLGEPNKQKEYDIELKLFPRSSSSGFYGGIRHRFGGRQ